MEVYTYVYLSIRSRAKVITEANQTSVCGTFSQQALEKPRAGGLRRPVRLSSRRSGAFGARRAMSLASGVRCHADSAAPAENKHGRGMLEETSRLFSRIDDFSNRSQWRVNSAFK